MNSAHLDAFYACVQTGNFTKAAKRLGITQSALSQRIKNLEDELATTLLIRDRAGPKLTESGEAVVRYCKVKQQSESELISELKNEGQSKHNPAELSGLIRIGGFSSVMRSLILPALSPVLKTNSQVSIRMVSKEVHELYPLLQSGEIDFLVLNHEIKREGLVSKILGYEENVLVQKRGYKGAEIYLDNDEDDLTTLTYLKKKPLAAVNRRYLDDVYGLIDGVREGLGRAILPLHLISPLKDVEIIDLDKKVKIPICLHYYEQSFYSRLHHSVVQALAEL